MFWLTLRQFALECSARRRGSRLDAESLETLNETDGILVAVHFDNNLHISVGYDNMWHGGVVARWHNR